MSRLMNLEKEDPSLVSEHYLIHSMQEKICELMAIKGITKTKLAHLVGVSKSEISRLLSEDRNLNLRTVAKIFSALGEELKVLTQSEYSGLARSYTIDKTSAQVQWHIQRVEFQKTANPAHAFSGFKMPVNHYGRKNAK